VTEQLGLNQPNHMTFKIRIPGLKGQLQVQLTAVSRLFAKKNPRQCVNQTCANWSVYMHSPNVYCFQPF